MTSEDYKKAYRAGKKEYQARALAGKNPALDALDELISESDLASERRLGVMDIPLSLVAGTRCVSRSNAFAANYMPVLNENSEFARKWINLGTSQEKEGIREPVKAYEYMNRYYIQEGNKRVSVMKYLKADSISAEVTRLLPKKTEEKENKLYYEFVDFHSLSGIWQLVFSNLGDYRKLQTLLGKKPDEAWTEEEREDVCSCLARFQMEYEAKYGKPDIRQISDAFLTFLTVYDYGEVDKASTSELKTMIQSCDKEFRAVGAEEKVLLKLEPQPEKKSLVSQIMPKSAKGLKAAFIYEKSPEVSSWIYSHELGRAYLEQAIPELETITYFYTPVQEAAETIARAVEAGCSIIFTTSPAFVQASVKAAVLFPQVRILNCSLYTAHRSIRTYYARMHEAKFLMGVVAGTMAPQGKIHYLADYPIFGSIASINAFALGAKMTNPRAKVWVDWSSAVVEKQAEKEAFECYCGVDMVSPEDGSNQYGLYTLDGERMHHLAMPLYNWGVFYEKLVRSVMDGAWKQDEKDYARTVNYWWGMSSDIVDIVLSRKVPIGTRRLIRLLKERICYGDFNPFAGIIYSQNGVIQGDPDGVLSPDEVIRMEWLAENVIGSIPDTGSLKEKAIPVVMEQGVDRG